MFVDRIFIFSIIIILITISLVVLVGYLVKKHKHLVKTYQSLFVGVLAVIASTIAGVMLMYGYYYSSHHDQAIEALVDYNDQAEVNAALFAEVNYNLVVLTHLLVLIELRGKENHMFLRAQKLSFSDVAFKELAGSGKLGKIRTDIISGLYYIYGRLPSVEKSLFQEDVNVQKTLKQNESDIFAACIVIEDSQKSLDILRKNSENSQKRLYATYERLNSWFEYGDLEFDKVPLSNTEFHIPEVCKQFKSLWGGKFNDAKEN